MARSADSFKRGAPKFKAQPQVLVICEDTKSAKTYFEEAAVHFRASARVAFSHCGRTDPRGIVEAAVKRGKQFDRVLCVLDRDAHDRLNFDEAVALEAKNPKITLLISYPCFEFWLLLHFGFTRAPIVGAGAHSAGDRVVQSLRAKPGMKDYAKGSIEGLFVKLLPQLPDANRHAEKTLQEAQTDGEMNPSTPLHQLMQLLMALGQPVPVRA